MKDLKEQLSVYKTMDAELYKDNRALKNLIEKSLTPTSKRETKGYLVREDSLPDRVKYSSVDLSRATFYKPPHTAPGEWYPIQYKQQLEFSTLGFST